MQVEIQIFNGKEYYRNVEKGEKYFIRGNNYLHRVVWAFYNGEIPKGYHVHHIDENTANNDISNLALMEGGEHIRLHTIERMQNPEYLQFLHDNINKARFYASIWHGSPEGIEWHKKQAQKTLRQMQQKQVRHYLLHGNSITPLEALRKFGSLRLSALIYNLRWDEGLPIVTEKIQVSPRKRVAKYYIDPKYLEEYNNNLNKK